MTIHIFVSRDEQMVRVVYRDHNSEDVVEDHRPATIKKNGGQVNVCPIHQPEGGYSWTAGNPVLTVPTSRTIIKYVDSLNSKGEIKWS